MKGYKLTIEQKKEIEGKCFAANQYFNPAEDINGEYFIFHKEVEDCDNKDFLWVKNLPMFEYIPNDRTI